MLEIGWTLSFSKFFAILLSSQKYLPLEAIVVGKSDLEIIRQGVREGSQSWIRQRELFRRLCNRAGIQVPVPAEGEVDYEGMFFALLGELAVVVKLNKRRFLAVSDIPCRPVDKKFGKIADEILIEAGGYFHDPNWEKCRLLCVRLIGELVEQFKSLAESGDTS